MLSYGVNLTPWEPCSTDEVVHRRPLGRLDRIRHQAGRPVPAAAARTPMQGISPVVKGPAPIVHPPRNMDRAKV